MVSVWAKCELVHDPVFLDTLCQGLLYAVSYLGATEGFFHACQTRTRNLTLPTFHPWITSGRASCGPKLPSRLSSPLSGSIEQLPELSGSHVHVSIVERHPVTNLGIRYTCIGIVPEQSWWLFDS